MVSIYIHLRTNSGNLYCAHYMKTMRYTKCYVLFILFVMISLSCSIDNDVDDTIVLPSSSHYIIVFGDIQKYTEGSNIVYYDSSIDWIISQLDKGVDVCAVLEVGDVTQNNLDNQWAAFRESTIELANKVPFFTCTGNHDYEWKEQAKIHDRSTTLINKYAHFNRTDNQIVEYYSDSQLENYIAKIVIGDTPIYLLVLEFGPRMEVVEWARNYVRTFSSERFILMTHEWLSAQGIRLNAGTHAQLQFEGYSSYSTPEEIWNLLVKDNDNIVCVLCGHEKNFSCCYVSENNYGRKVPQIMFNLQFLPNGGDGIVQIWKISDNEQSFNICAFDTKNQSWYLTDSTLYKVPLFYEIQH